MITAILSAMGLAMDSPPADAASEGWIYWVLITLLVFLVVVAALLIGILTKYLRLGINLFLDTPLPVTANLQDYTSPEGEVVTFPSLEGRSLTGMFINRPPGVSERGVVIFCHEFASDMRSAGRYARSLIDAGYTVFTFDFRGHGKSFMPPHFEPRHWPSNYEVNDILAAIAFVKSRVNTNGTGIGVLGISRGASAAVIASAIRPSVRCLVVDGVFSTDFSVDGLMKRWVQIFARVDLARADRSFLVYRVFRTLMLFYVELKCRCRFPSTRRALTKLDSVPILFIHGERDAYVPPEQTRVLYDLKPGVKDIWVCPGAKHNQAVATDPKTYAARVTGFFDRHLTAQPAPAQAADRAPTAAPRRATA